ncbi:MAG: hypothetical protein U1F43_04815 [Myxococcota bacterium]
MTTLLNAPMLPSPLLRAHYAFAISERVAKVKASLHTTVLDGLGDLALALARRPLRQWFGSEDELARLLTARWTWPEATAIVEVASKVGLLVPRRHQPAGGAVMPRDYGHFIWLGARRIAMTEDQDELMSYRLNGSLFDMFAMSAGFVADKEAAANLVRLMVDRPAPWDDILDLGAALGAAAVAWGAPVEEDVGQHLVERALTWTQPLGQEWNREIGTALLVLEAQYGPMREDLTNLAIERFNELVGTALGDADLVNHPGINACLETQLAVMLAGYRPSAASIRKIMGRLPASHAHLVGRAVARISAPGDERNALLVESARAALEQGNTAALTILDALVEPLAGAIGPIHDVLQSLLEHLPGDPPTVQRAFGACQAVASWESCPELTLHLLARVVAARAEPEVRIAAAAALSRHGERLGGARQILIDTLERELTDADNVVVAGACGAALHLGSAHPRLPALAIALAADGVPFDLLGPALDDGLRQVPAHAAGFEEMLAQYRGDAVITAAALGLASHIGDALHREAGLGPFFIPPPLEAAAIGALSRFLLPLAADLDTPEFAADAATTCAWVMRGDRGFALSLLNLREFAGDAKLKAMYDLALGACGSAEPEILQRLGKDATQGPPELAAAAGVAFRVLLETFDQADLVEAWLPIIRARCDLPGPQQEPLTLFLHQLATMPLGRTAI